MDKDLILRTQYVLEFLFIIISIFLLMIMSLHIQIIGILFIPILIVLLYVRYSKYKTILVITINLIIPSILFSSILPLILGVTYVIVGVIFGICIKKNIKFINTFCILSVSVIIANFINLIANVYLIMRINFWQFAQEIVVNFNKTIKIYLDLGVDISNTQYIEIMNKIMTPKNILSVLPSVMVIFSIIIAFIIYLIAKKILSKSNYRINDIVAFNKWYLEPKIGTVLIIIICLSIFMYSKNIFIGEVIYITTYSLLHFSVLIIGLSVINYFFINKMKFSNKFCIGISIIVIISPLNVLLPIIGLIDLIADIRGIDVNSLGTALRKKLYL